MLQFKILTFILLILILSLYIILYNRNDYPYNVISNLKNIPGVTGIVRKLSINNDLITGESLRTVNGHVPLASCPIGYYSYSNYYK